MSWGDVPWGSIVGAVGSAIQSHSSQSSSEEQAALNRQLQAEALKEKAQVDTANFSRQNPEVQMNNSTRGDVLANVQDSKSTGDGRDIQFSGGLRPSLLSDNSRQLGSLTSRQALLSALDQADSSGNIGGIPDPYKVPKLSANTNATDQSGSSTNQAVVPPNSPTPAPTPSNTIYQPKVNKKLLSDEELRKIMEQS